MIYVLMEFLVVFTLCYILHLVLMVFKKKGNKFNSKKLRVEESFLIGKYNIDFKKFKKKEYKKFLHIISLANSFILALTVILVKIVKGAFWQILISILFIVPLILIMYMIIGKFYQKKGKIKDV